jgi:hypothetical protein
MKQALQQVFTSRSKWLLQILGLSEEELSGNGERSLDGKKVTKILINLHCYGIGYINGNLRHYYMPYL